MSTPALDNIFKRLATSKFRTRFHLGPRELSYFRVKGRAVILRHARDFIEKRLAPAEPENDGQQTPMRGHPVFIAQHATATCCRSCLATWHGIPKRRPLAESEIDHVVAAIARWLDQETKSKGTS